MDPDLRQHFRRGNNKRRVGHPVYTPTVLQRSQKIRTVPESTLQRIDGDAKYGRRNHTIARKAMCLQLIGTAAAEPSETPGLPVQNVRQTLSRLVTNRGLSRGFALDSIFGIPNTALAGGHPAVNVTVPLSLPNHLQHLVAVTAPKIFLSVTTYTLAGERARLLRHAYLRHPPPGG